MTDKTEQALVFSKMAETLDRSARLLRRRSVRLLMSPDNEVDFDAVDQLDDAADRATILARQLDARAVSLAGSAAATQSTRLDESTERLKHAAALIDRVGDIVAISSKLLLAGMATATMIADPTGISAIGAATAFNDLAQSIQQAVNDH